MDENPEGKLTQRHTHMGEGDYREIHSNDQSTYIERQYNYSQIPATNPKKRDHIQQKLLHWVATEVKKRLQQSLHNRVYILLEKEENSEQVQVQHPWNIDIKVGKQPSYPLPKDAPIEQEFYRSDIAGRLLILGAPGSGKTTLLLKLAKQLVQAAKEHPQYPIPVLLSLSLWNGYQKSLKDWMVTNLKAKYGIDQDIAKKMIEEEKIIPLLDDLDKLVAVQKEKCVKQINDFFWSQELVVCSCLKKNQSYSKNLRLNGSIFINPLTIEQIKEYVLKTEGENLWNCIKADSKLIKSAQTPLFLNIIIVASQEICFERWKQCQSSEERRGYLFDAYIQRMLKRPYKGKQKPYKDKDTLFWLGWLAKQLIRENKTELMIEKIEQYWLYDRIKITTYGIILGVINILFIGIVFVEFFGLIYGLVSGIILDISTLNNRLYYGLYGLMIGVIIGVISGKKYSNIEYINTPNTEIQQSIKNIATFTSITFLPCVVLFWLLISEMEELIPVLIGGFGLSLLFGIIISLFSVIQHFSLRLVLWLNRKIPWNYARFLDYSTDRLFLQRVGGGYRFIHDLLRQHFADKY